MKEQILIASTNRHKVEEIEKIFNFSKIKFVSLSSFEDVPEAIEDGHSFEENALIKAKHYYKYTQMPVIADDSGLVVPALNGEPGIHSARYAGEHSAYDKNNDLLLSRMEHLSGEQRFAYFVCVIVYFDGSDTLISEGRAEGRIIESLKGEGGFGYDPLFFYPEAKMTFAEMVSEEKNRVSHRSRALHGLYDKLIKHLDWA
jgi:XTP/dITP diphosphohydrolase